MENPTLPDDLLSKIAKKMADNILILCGDPETIQAGGRHNSSELVDEGQHRSFFMRCFAANNPTVVYYEGLHVVTHEGDINGIIKLLQRHASAQADATLACAIIFICAGNSFMDGLFLQLFAPHHSPLDSDVTGHLGEELVEEIKKFCPPYNNTYCPTFCYPSSHGIKTPPCAYYCYIVFGAFNNACNCCYILSCVRRVRQIL